MADLIRSNIIAKPIIQLRYNTNYQLISEYSSIKLIIMKRVKIYFLLISIFCVISCGDDNYGDPNDYYHPYGYIEGIFPNAEFGRELILVYNGDTLTNKTVEFDSRGKVNPQALLAVENVIKGEAKSVIIADLTETESPDNSEITRLIFDGVYYTKSGPVEFSGFIEPFKLLLELKE